MSTTSISLLDRLQSQPEDPASWRRLVDLYTPLVRFWLRERAVAADDADDLVQEVLAVVVRKLPTFSRQPQNGAFRSWLRHITVYCLRDFVRYRRLRPAGTGDSNFLALLNQLEDDDSEISRRWDREHDLHVARRLLEQIQQEFAPGTWVLFERVALKGIPAAEVAAQQGTTVNAVFIAKSRVLSRLREEAKGLVE